MTEWKFEVIGNPRPKGSWTIIPRKNSLHIFRNGERYYRCKDMVLIPASDPLLKQWVTALQWAAKGADPPKHPIAGPWWCSCTFWFTPPDCRIGETYAIGDKKEASGSTSPTGDEDKLRRAVLDALQGIFWVNDRHVADGGQTKLYRQEPGALIVVRYLEAEQLSLV